MFRCIIKQLALIMFVTNNLYYLTAYITQVGITTISPLVNKHSSEEWLLVRQAGDRQHSEIRSTNQKPLFTQEIRHDTYVLRYVRDSHSHVNVVVQKQRLFCTLLRRPRRDELLRVKTMFYVDRPQKPQVTNS